MKKIIATVLFLSIYFSITKLTAQTQLETSGAVMLVLGDSEMFHDYVVPSLDSLVNLILEVEGADGGWIEFTYTDRFNMARTQRVNGGEGATVSAKFNIGNNLGDIPPGAILRMIIGQRGDWAKYDLLENGNYGAGGGGGSAILISKTNGKNWNVLLVAGGGGGAGVQKSSEVIHNNPGMPGNSGEIGIGGDEREIAAGGRMGRGGESVDFSGGGGGAYGDGTHEPGILQYGNAGWKDHELSGIPIGGVGGIQSNTHRGGWGFGGGGSGDKSGGGGGGFSGGGAGYSGFGGGGGGSFIESNFVSPQNGNKQQNGNTNNPGDGCVRYKITKNSH